MFSMLLSASIDGTRSIQTNNNDEKYTVCIIHQLRYLVKFHLRILTKVYQITVRNNLNQIVRTIERRYSEFENLHSRLSSTTLAPNFPRKILLGRRSPKIVEQRRQLLELYLSEIIRRSNQQSIMSEDLVRFLKLDSVDMELTGLKKEPDINENNINKNLLDHNASISVFDLLPWKNDRAGSMNNNLLLSLQLQRF